MRHACISVAIVALAAFGCGGAPANTANQGAGGSQPAGQPAQTPAQSAQSMAQALQQMAQGAQQMQTGPDGKPITVVDFEKLVALLPDVSGWEKGKVDASTNTVGFTISQANVRYTKGDFHAKVTITDAALSQALMMPYTMAMGLANSRSTTGYERPATFGGQPGHEKWNSENKHATTTIIVNKRFIVEVEGTDIDSPDIIRDIVSAIDIAKLAALK